MYYRGAQAAIVVYDIQNQDSFQRAKTWVKELHKQVSLHKKQKKKTNIVCWWHRLAVVANVTLSYIYKFNFFCFVFVFCYMAVNDRASNM